MQLCDSKHKEPKTNGSVAHTLITDQRIAGLSSNLPLDVLVLLYFLCPFLYCTQCGNIYGHTLYIGLLRQTRAKLDHSMNINNVRTTGETTLCSGQWAGVFCSSWTSK